MELVIGIVALLLGVLLGFMIGRGASSRGTAEQRMRAEVLQTQYDAAEQGRQEALLNNEKQRDEYERKLTDLRRENADTVDAAKAEARKECSLHYDQLIQQMESTHSNLLEAKEKAYADGMKQLQLRHTEAMESMNARFQETIATMREEVTNVTGRLLKDRQKEFADQSQESISKIMEPLQENIRQMREAVKENTEKSTDYNGQLKTGIESVLRQSEAAKQSAEKLANALTVGTKVQGNWGEKILAEILKSTGLKEGVNFDTQAFIRDEQGNQLKGESGAGMQPDVILHLEPGHDVVIDSKVSLTAFFRYNDAETEEERKRYLKEHIDSLKRHVKELSKKNYSSYLKGALDYVIMFVPVSQALYLATAEDTALWREAMEQKVYIADEQTIYAALKIVALNWRQQEQAANHEEVYKLADEMLKRVGVFMDKYSEIGKCLDTAQKAYSAGYDKLRQGGQSIPTTCNKLIKLGAKYEKKKGMLPELIDLSIDTDTDTE